MKLILQHGIERETVKEEKEREGTRNERSGKGLIYIETAKRYGTTCIEEMIPDYETMDYAARRNCFAKIDRFLLYRPPIYSMRSPRKLQN